MQLGGIHLYCHWLPSVIVPERLGGTLGNQVLYFLEAGICHLIPGKDRILLEYCPERLSVVAQMWHNISHVCYHSNEAG